MKLIALTCPNCSAQINIDVDAQRAFCTYCGSQVLIDDQVQHVKLDDMESAGFEFERGRMKAQNTINTDLVSQLKEVLAIEKKLNELEKRLYSCEMEKNEIRQSKDVLNTIIKKPTTGLKYLGYFLLADMIILILLCSSVRPTSLALIINAFIFAIALLICLYLRKQEISEYKAKVDGKNKAIANLTAKQESIRNELEKYKKNPGLSIVPNEYRSVECLQYFISILDSGSAHSMHEAIMCYDQYKNRK